jgi:hypothetical protein
VPLEPANYKTWEGFDESNHQEVSTPYLTEAGATVFDAIVVAPDDVLDIKNTEHMIIDSRVYVSSLLALGLGRSSTLFAWDEETEEVDDEEEDAAEGDTPSPKVTKTRRRAEAAVTRKSKRTR